MQENKVTILNDIEHALLRAPMYIGNLNEQTIRRPLLKNNNIVFEEVNYSAALLKLFRELLDNSIDEYLRTKGTHANIIQIELDDNKFVVKDNGRGIPIKPSYDSSGNEIPDSWMPLNAWTELKAGSNFDDSIEDNQTLGQNGVGASLATIFSKKFIGITDDGSKHFRLKVKNNMADIEYNITDTTGDTGTMVQFYPDLERFGLTEIPEIYQNLLAFDILFLSITYPDIKFKFNKKLIKTQNISQLNKQYFNNELMVVELEGVSIALGSSENISSHYDFIHFINGLNAYEGGKTLDYIEKRIFEPLLERLQKKYKNLKMSDLKSKLFLIAIFKGVNNPRFSNQMKTYCTNNVKTFQHIAEEILELSKGRFIEKIYKNKTIINPIIDFYKAQMMVEEMKIAKASTKTIKDIPKYWKPSKEYNYLFLTEGDSAVGSIIQGIGRSDKGYFPLKGKILNVLKSTFSNIFKSPEIRYINDILGIDPSNPEKSDYKYNNVVIATDADVDGSHISALLITLFYRFAPELLLSGRVFLLRTPIVILYKNDVLEKFIFDLDELKEFEKNIKGKNNYSYKYTKGLGGLSEIEWEELFIRHPFETLLRKINIKDAENDFNILELWMNEDRDYRKEIIKSNISKFNINVI